MRRLPAPRLTDGDDHVAVRDGDRRTRWFAIDVVDDDVVVAVAVVDVDGEVESNSRPGERPGPREVAERLGECFRLKLLRGGGLGLGGQCLALLAARASLVMAIVLETGPSALLWLLVLLLLLNVLLLSADLVEFDRDRERDWELMGDELHALLVLVALVRGFRSE